MSKVEINIRINPQPSYLRTIFVTAVEVLVIYLGVLAGSAAMQWAGLIGVLLVGLSYAIMVAKKNDGLSVDDARKRLDEIEAEARA